MDKRDKIAPGFAGLGDSILLVDMQGAGISLASAIRHRIAEVAVSDARWMRILSESVAPLEMTLVPDSESISSISVEEWAVPRFSSPSWRHISREMLRIGFDPSMVAPASDADSASVAAESLLWLIAHAASWPRPTSPAGLEVVVLDLEGPGGLSPAHSGASEPARFYDAATGLGPSATSSLAAILARACGEPAPLSDGVPRGEPGTTRKNLFGRRSSHWLAEQKLYWVQAAFLSAFDPHRSFDERERKEALCDILLPAVLRDFSYGVLHGSSSAVYRDMFEEFLR